MIGQYKIGLLIAFALFIPQGLASVCTVMGYVSYDDGTIVEASTPLTIADLDIGTVYEIETGGKDWPVDNFFVRSFTCNWEDRIEVVYSDEEQTVKKSFRFDHYPYEINLVLAKPEKPEPGEPEPDEPKPDDSSSGGGGMDGAPVYDFGVIINDSQVSRIENNTRIRWYVINDTLDISMIIGDVRLVDDYIVILFDTLSEEVIFRQQEPNILDLNNDGNPDTEGTLIEIDGSDAYLIFDKILQIPKALELPVEVEPEEEQPQPVPNISKSQLSLMILGIVLAICFTIVIIMDRKYRKNA